MHNHEFPTQLQLGPGERQQVEEHLRMLLDISNYAQTFDRLAAIIRLDLQDYIDTEKVTASDNAHRLAGIATELEHIRDSFIEDSLLAFDQGA